MKKKLLSTLLAAVMAASLFTGCSKGLEPAAESNTSTKAGDTDGKAAETAEQSTSSGKIKEFTAFHAVPGKELEPNNVVQDLIAEKIGAKCKETWLTGQTAEEAVGVLIAGCEYPDFLTASTGHSQMMEAGAYIPLDEYWEDYPNVKNYLTESEWNKVRAADGHVYIMPQFGIINEYDTGTTHWGQAFWIQVRVLKWAGYPKIETLDEYFRLIKDYIAANPDMEDGTPNIAYTILCEDWRYYCLENVPFFLDGYPNDGCVIVDPETYEAIDYNTTDTAKRYFNKLNEEFKNGYVDPESFTQSYDQYIAKLSTGRVLGMVDQLWNFNDAVNALKTQGLNDCIYVPLGITIDKGITDRYHTAAALDVSNGLGITVSCKDIPGAMKFLNDILSVEIQTLRFWGIEGVDYMTGDDGLYFRNEDMRKNAVDATYKVANLCEYSYFPRHEGMNLDGINAWSPDCQPAEFFEGLEPEVKECLQAYGAETYVEMLSPSQENEPWFPMWSYSNNMTSETPGGAAWAAMEEVKHEYLPKVCMASDFEAAWKEYLEVYHSRVDVDAFLSEISDEVQRRIAVAQGS